MNEKLIEWADLRFVMERHHKQIINQKYSSLLNGKQIIILEIPDEFQYIDQELIDMLETAMEPYL